MLRRRGGAHHPQAGPREPDGARWKLGEEGLRPGRQRWHAGVRYGTWHDRPHATVAKRLRRYGDELFAFVRDPAVPPTDNLAEPGALPALR